MAEAEVAEVQIKQENAEKTSKSTRNPKKSPAKSRGYLWKDVEVLELLAVMSEETIMLSLDNAKTPKQKRACYNAIHVQLQRKGTMHKYRDTGIDCKESDTMNCESEEDLDEELATVETDENPTEKDDDDLDSKYLEEKLIQQEKKQDFKICKSKKVKKKTKLEKTIELLGESFKTACQKETEVMVQLEETHQKIMLDHEIRLKELDNERRREERQHELLTLQMMCRNRSKVPPHGEVSFKNVQCMDVLS